MTGLPKLHVLGPFAATGPDGATIHFPTRKAQALLACLALEGDLTRDRAANLFWGDRNDARARHNVRQTLSKIRRAAGPIVASTGDLLRLDTARCSVDLIEFERLADSPSRSDLERAVALYRGELLEGHTPKEAEYESWLLQARERLQTVYCTALDRIGAACAAAGEIDAAVEALRRRLAVDRAHEPAHRSLIQIYADSGRTTDALRQYDTCRTQLERDLGVAPSAETTALYEALRASTRAGGIRLEPRVASLANDTRKPKIAVLPFENLSNTEDYFADGITEDVITALSHFHSLHVIARGSSFVYKGQDTPDDEIATALGARYLVRGSVRRTKERVRINVQLLDGPAGTNIWAQRFDRTLADVFLVEDEITDTIVSTLADRIEASELTRVRAAPIERLEAYDFVLRGKDHHHRFSAADCAACIDLFSRAIERDPGYAVAHAWLACGLGQAMVFDLDDPSALVDRSQAAAERGLELDENESECHRILAQVHLTRGNLARSLRHQERALFLNPNDDRSVCSMGEILTFAGRAEEGERWVRKSLALNPYHPQRYWTHLARAVFHLGRYRETLDILDQIGRPRRDDLAYAVAAARLAGDKKAAARNVEALRVAFPDFEPAAFVAALPYERDEDRRVLLDALVAAQA